MTEKEQLQHAEILAAEAGLMKPASISEKHAAEDPAVHSRAERLHEFRETEGYIIDIEEAEDAAAKASGLKLARDGHTVLIPQPSDDVNDPLNWSWRRKHLVLFAVAFASFLPDYGSATGAVTLIPQAA
jgi:hypothetical protein